MEPDLEILVDRTPRGLVVDCRGRMDSRASVAKALRRAVERWQLPRWKQRTLLRLAEELEHGA